VEIVGCDRLGVNLKLAVDQAFPLDSNPQAAQYASRKPRAWVAIFVDWSVLKEAFMDLLRRQWLVGICSVGAGVALLGCDLKSAKDEDEERAEKAGKENAGTEVTATEDLMREHGVLRRCLLVYQESVTKLRSNAAAVPPDALQKTATLFRNFGEDYHEKKLEETYIFPAIQKAGGAATGYLGVLSAQHQRGREITDYIVSATNSGKLSNAREFALALEAFARMYEHHAAVEDTIIFPAWKQTMTKDELDKMSDDFEEIEQKQFGKDGYEDAVKRIAEIEASLGLADLAQYTAPPPPATKEPKAPPEKSESEKPPNN
jgi:hemerythrin-like domain-containing protein